MNSQLAKIDFLKLNNYNDSTLPEIHQNIEATTLSWSALKLEELDRKAAPAQTWGPLVEDWISAYAYLKQNFKKIVITHKINFNRKLKVFLPYLKQNDC